MLISTKHQHESAIGFLCVSFNEEKFFWSKQIYQSSFMNSAFLLKTFCLKFVNFPVFIAF